MNNVTEYYTNATGVVSPKKTMKSTHITLK